MRSFVVVVVVVVVVWRRDLGALDLGPYSDFRLIELTRG